jgi:SAM-dependent methyltransferase
MKGALKMTGFTGEKWSDADACHMYVGRWSERIAREFVRWLAVPTGSTWLDLGCGPGPVSRMILDTAEPERVLGVDRSPEYIEQASRRIEDERASFAIGDAMSLDGIDDDAFDAVVSGLVLNFLPDPAQALSAMNRVVRPGGTVAAYVWDYAEGMQLMRIFWDAAVELFPEAASLDEGQRFSICNPEGLAQLWQAAGLVDVETRGIEIPTVFQDFDDYWTPFLGGQGSAPGYVATLTPTDRDALRNLIATRLPFNTDGSIHLTARAWAVRGTVSP